MQRKGLENNSRTMKKITSIVMKQYNIETTKEQAFDCIIDLKRTPYEKIYMLSLDPFTFQPNIKEFQIGCDQANRKKISNTFKNNNNNK